LYIFGRTMSTNHLKLIIEIFTNDSTNITYFVGRSGGPKTILESKLSLIPR
jgi:hypothetical protein